MSQRLHQAGMKARMRNGVIGMSDMSGIGEVLNGIIKKAVENNPVEDGDYLDSEGFIVCGKCHTRRQVEIEVPRCV